MATATRTDRVTLRPSEEIRQAQELVRSILITEDLRDEPQMLEAVTDRLDQLQDELGTLAGKQQMFEAWTKS